MSDLSVPFQEIFKYAPILDRRYVDCDLSAHQGVADNYCGHCYRHVNYETPVTDNILLERAKLSYMQQPLDAPWILQEKESETAVERLKDYFDGLTQLGKELENKEGLERQL